MRTETSRFTICFSISWCDSSGKKLRSEIPLAQLIIDESGNLCGFKELENGELNLYNYAQ